MVLLFFMFFKVVVWFLVHVLCFWFSWFVWFVVCIFICCSFFLKSKRIAHIVRSCGLVCCCFLFLLRCFFLSFRFFVFLSFFGVFLRRVCYLCLCSLLLLYLSPDKKDSENCFLDFGILLCFWFCSMLCVVLFFVFSWLVFFVCFCWFVFNFGCVLCILFCSR